jgi:hypothetical protein
MTNRPGDPKPSQRRNPGAVFLVIAGGFALLATLANGILRSIPDAPTNLFGTVFGLLLASFVLVPLVIVVAFTYLGVGGRGVYPLGGYSVRARMLFFLTGVVALAAQYSLIGPALVPVGPDESLVPAEATTIALDSVAIALAILTSVVVIRTGVVRGFARWALPVAIVLTAASLIISNAIPSNWGDIPHGVGIVILGLGYWRAGVHVPAPVPEAVESLAE